MRTQPSCSGVLPSRAAESMNQLHRHCLCLLLVLVGLACGPDAQAEEIQPPFGLRWGESAERMQRLLQGAKATIVERRMIEGREAWNVEGLIQSGLKRTMFYFQKGELVEVELQYQKEDWNDSQYDGFMGDVRKRLEQKYGEGQLVANRTDKEASTAITQRLVSYKWNQNNTAIELVYFAATNASQAFRTLSVHYKTY
jgi:hypothetical protein